MAHPANRYIDRSFRLVCQPFQQEAVESLLRSEGFAFYRPQFSQWARILTKEPKPIGRSLAAYFGLIYIQDKASMLPPLYLQPWAGSLVLDMCASPGGKAGFLAQLMGSQGLVVANEPHKQRLHTLRGILHSLNVTNAVTSGYAGQTIRLQKEAISSIMLDAPCSGWGTADKHPEVVEIWHQDRLEPLVNLQRKLLAQAEQILAPGGRILYSTCTTNYEENEQQVIWAQKELGLELEELQPMPGFYINQTSCSQCKGALNINGPKSRSQSFFLAGLKKRGSLSDYSGEPAENASSKRGLEEISSLEGTQGLQWGNLPPGRITLIQDKIFFLPQAAEKQLPGYFNWKGFFLGRGQGGKIRVAPRARVLIPPAEEVNGLKIGEIDDLQRLLSGQSFRVSRSKTPLAFYWQELPLGWLTVKGNRCLWSDRI